MTIPCTHRQPHCQVMTFPRSDALFRYVVLSELERMERSGEPFERARRNLEPRFPGVHLHHQRAVDIAGAPTNVSFAFRDGRDAVSYPTDRWWARPGVARATVNARGRLTAANDAFRAIFGLARPLPQPVLVRDIFPAEFGEELWRAALRSSSRASLSSQMVVGSDTAEPRALEIHVEKDGGRPERYDIAVRTLAERRASSVRRAVGASSLSALGRTTWGALLRGAIARQLRQGERLSAALAGDPWAALVVSGIVRLYTATEGLEPTVMYARDGSLLGTHIIPADESLAIGLQAATPSLVLQIDPDEIERAQRADGRFARALVTDARAAAHTLVQTYAARSSADLHQRLARELLMIGELQEDDSLIAVTEQQLADGLGSIRESVARALATFRRDGIVATTRYGLMPLDFEALRAVRDGHSPLRAVRDGRA